jgi:Cobalt transport protein.
MIDELFYIEKSAYQQSLIHALDARIKLVTTFALIIATVALPYSRTVFVVAGFFLFFIAFLWSLSTLSPLIFLKRLGTIMPFGLFIILFQVFLTNRYYSTFHILLHLPLGIHVYAESMEFASILFLKFLVCVSAIVLLSSTTKLQDMLEGPNSSACPSILSSHSV